MWLNGIPKKIILYRYAKFTSRFWKELFIGLSTELALTTCYHAHAYRQIERVIMILEELLRMHVMHQQQKWEVYLALVEFSYNNWYQEPLRMSLFEEL